MSNVNASDMHSENHIDANTASEQEVFKYFLDVTRFSSSAEMPGRFQHYKRRELFLHETWHNFSGDSLDALGEQFLREIEESDAPLETLDSYTKNLQTIIAALISLQQDFEEEILTRKVDI